MDWNGLVNAMVNGLFVGIGATFGTWLVTKHFIHNLERLEALLKDKNKQQRR
jgi:hypothetical protein